MPDTAPRAPDGAASNGQAPESGPEEPLVERLNPALMEARIFAFAATTSFDPVTPAPNDPGLPATSAPPSAPGAAAPPAVASCTPEGSRPPANPPRVFRADGAVVIPDYVEYRDALNRLWVWDGTNWLDKATGRPANAC